MNYFVQHEGEMQGPLSKEQIKARLAHKSLSESALIRPVGGMAWETLDSVEHFRKPRRRALDPKIAAVLLVLVLLGVLLSIATHRKFKAQADLAQGISNCRKIIAAMRIYSSGNNWGPVDGLEPRPQSSNEYFRRMFVFEVADDEMIFGCPGSDFQPDGKIGKAPKFPHALEPGENHWAVTWRLDDSVSGIHPIVVENPTEATWPPKWNPDLAGTGKPGRAWPDGKIIVGMNDSSVSLLPLESDKGNSVGLKPYPDGKPIFYVDQGSPPLEILNVVKKGGP